MKYFILSLILFIGCTIPKFSKSEKVVLPNGKIGTVWSDVDGVVIVYYFVNDKQVSAYFHHSELKKE